MCIRDRNGVDISYRTTEDMPCYRMDENAYVLIKYIPARRLDMEDNSDISLSLIHISLKDMKIGETVVVKKLHGDGAVRRRIMDMGITKGVSVYLRKVAPLGDPLEITVRSYELSIRKGDAEMIEVE